MTTITAAQLDADEREFLCEHRNWDHYLEQGHAAKKVIGKYIKRIRELEAAIAKLREGNHG